MPNWLEKIIALVSMGSVCLFFLYKATAWGMIYSYPAYTIASTTSATYDAKGFYQIRYLYYVASVQYEGTKWNRLQEPPGKRYVVKYCSENPDWSKLYWDKPVPDSIPNFRIWSKEPFWPTPPRRLDSKLIVEATGQYNCKAAVVLLARDAHK